LTNTQEHRPRELAGGVVVEVVVVERKQAERRRSRRTKLRERPRRSRITRLIGAYQEELISLDALRTVCPSCVPARPACTTRSTRSTANPPTGRSTSIADNLEDFLTGLRSRAATATVAERQRVLRLPVKDVLVGPGPEVRGSSWARRLQPTARVTR
jgi:hypothetical protein